MTEVQQGKVVSYEQGRGVVELVNGTLLPSLGPTYFHIGRPSRDPRSGDSVDVVFSGTPTKVLYVRIRRDAKT